MIRIGHCEFVFSAQMGGHSQLAPQKIGQQYLIPPKSAHFCEPLTAVKATYLLVLPSEDGEVSVDGETQISISVYCTALNAPSDFRFSVLGKKKGFTGKFL